MDIQVIRKGQSSVDENLTIMYVVVDGEVHCGVHAEDEWHALEQAALIRHDEVRYAQYEREQEDT